MYRLNIKLLRTAAAAKGDTTGYAIARRTGLAESTVCRWLSGQTQPGSISLITLRDAYGVATDDLLQAVDPAPAEVTAP